MHVLCHQRADRRQHPCGLSALAGREQLRCLLCHHQREFSEFAGDNIAAQGTGGKVCSVPRRAGCAGEISARNGADAVAYPEKQLAKWAAIRYTSNHIFSYIELDEQHAIIEVAVPEDWQGRSIGELDIRRKYGVNILGVKRNGKTDVNISPETVLDADMTLLVLGENQELKKHFRL